MTGWVDTPIKSLVYTNDDVVPETFPVDEEIHYLEISDVSEGHIRWSDPIKFGDAPSRARRRIRDGDVLVSTVRTYLRAVAGVAGAPRNAVASTGFATLRPRNIDSRFLQYAMLNTEVLDQIVAHSVGVSYPAINASDLVSIKIPVTNESTQRVIASFLDREAAEIDAFIADQEELIGLLAERRAATISHAVTKGLDLCAPMKDSGVEWLGEVPTTWSVQKLGWLARIGNGATPSRENASYWSEGSIPWLSSTVVNRGRVEEATEFVTPVARISCHLPMVQAGSLLIGLTGQGRTRGMVARLAIDSTISQHMAFVTSRAPLDSDFAYWVLTSAYDELRFRSDGNGGTKGGLTCEELASLRIPLPSLEEQRSIAHRLDVETAELDAAIADAREAIALSKERRSALISAAVTGKIDVRGRA